MKKRGNKMLKSKPEISTVKFENVLDVDLLHLMLDCYRGYLISGTDADMNEYLDCYGEVNRRMAYGSSLLT
jgi:hypothetical protein